MELLKQIAPTLKRVAILWNAGDLGMTMRYRASETGAKALGVSVQPLGVREPDDFEQTFAAMNREMPDAILMVAHGDGDHRLEFAPPFGGVRTRAAAPVVFGAIHRLFLGSAILLWTAAQETWPMGIAVRQSDRVGG
jgi:hypothetical protein